MSRISLRRVMAASAALLAPLGVIALTAVPAQASTTYHHGRWIGGQWFGEQYANGKWSVCIDPTKRFVPRTWYLQSSETGLTGAQTRALTELLWTHVPTTDGQAVALRGAALRIANPYSSATKVFNTYATTGERALASQWVSEAQAFQPGYKVNLAFSSLALPGTTGQAVFTVTSVYTGKARAGIKLAPVKGVNASVPSSLMSGSSFTYTRAANNSAPDIAATTVALSAGTLYVNHPGYNEQRLIARGTGHVVSGHGSYQNLVGQPNLSYSCSNCVPTVQVKAINNQKRAVQYHFYLNGVQKATFTLQPGATGNSSFVGVHAGKVTSGWSVWNGSAWTPPQMFTESLLIDCVPLPAVQVIAVTTCTSKSISADLPLNGTIAEWQLYVNGHLVSDALPGVDAPAWSPDGMTIAKPACGTTEVYNIFAQAKRLDGTWSVGQGITVTL